VSRHRILLTGATGYVGGRLLPVLEAAGHEVLCLARRPGWLADRVGSGTRVVGGDVLDKASMEPAFEGVDTLYYLVHSMGTARDFEQREAEGARNAAELARAHGCKRIVYLGGLADEQEALSPHLRSRVEVGRILRASGVPTVELRASIVIGSGSLSFELIRSLTEHLPVMVTPTWVSVQAQPIGIQDLIAYLVAALDVPLDASEVVEIGGTEQLSYRDLMQEYARQRGLRRWMIPLPVLTPHLSSLWLGMVTPLYARVGRKLLESMRHPSVVRSTRAAELFELRPRGASDAIRTALENEEREYSETHWTDAVSSGGDTGEPTAAAAGGFGGRRYGNRLVDARELHVDASPEDCFEVVESIGGANGWFAWNALWQLRGALDMLVGGVGMRRGRPTARALRAGDALDFWRVQEIDPPRCLRLACEMRLPGRAWLEFHVEPRDGGCTLRQTAIFDPLGLGGLLYWYAVYPFHGLVFRGLITTIARKARAAREARGAPRPG
jgi:uncharacterized protein YbjT (DUF2867 family)